MTTPRLCVAAFGGATAIITLCFGILHQSADAWRLLVALVPLLIVFIWWMVDRAALERRIRRLEARSEIANERRVAAQMGFTEVEHRLHEIEDRVVSIENFASPIHAAPDQADSLEKEDRTRHLQVRCVDKAISVRLPVNPQ